LLDLRCTVDRAVFFFVADRPVRVDVWTTRLLVPFFTALFRLAAFFDADVGFAGCRVDGFLTDVREVAAFFVATDLVRGVCLTDELAFFSPALRVAGARRAAVAFVGVDDFAADARLSAFPRARVVCPVVTDRARLRPTTLSAPGPGIRLVCSPVFQRIVIIAPFTDVTTPARGPDLDVTTTRSPTTAIGPPQERKHEYDRTNGDQEAPGHPVTRRQRRAPFRVGALIRW